MIGWQLGARIGHANDSDNWGMYAGLFAALLGGLAFIIAPYVSVRFFRWLRRKFATVPAIDIVAAGVGLVIGGVLSSLLAFPTSLLPNPFGQTVPFLVALVACGLSVFVVVLRKNDLMSLFFRRQGSAGGTRRCCSDTSVLIDGRIVDLVAPACCQCRLACRSSSCENSNRIANSDDPSRKLRGRRGLEALERLQREERVVVDMVEMDIEEEHEVDNKLIKLA